MTSGISLTVMMGGLLRMGEPAAVHDNHHRGDVGSPQRALASDK